MPKPWTVIIALHAIAASIALVIGAVQVLRPTKGDPFHKAIGRTWVGLMLFTSLTSYFFGEWTEPLDIFLRALATWTLFSVTAGIVMARRGNIDRHRGFMVGTYIGLVAAFIGVVAFRTRLVPSWFIAYPLMMSLIAVAVVAVSGFLLAGLFVGTRRHTGAVTP